MRYIVALFALLLAACTTSGASADPEQFYAQATQAAARGNAEAAGYAAQGKAEERRRAAVSATEQAALAQQVATQRAIDATATERARPTATATATMTPQPTETLAPTWTPAATWTATATVAPTSAPVEQVRTSVPTVVAQQAAPNADMGFLLPLAALAVLFIGGVLLAFRLVERS